MKSLYKKKESHFADSNRRPTHYECVALPTELKWQTKILFWQPAVLHLLLLSTKKFIRK